MNLVPPSDDVSTPRAPAEIIVIVALALWRAPRSGSATWGWPPHQQRDRIESSSSRWNWSRSSSTIEAWASAVKPLLSNHLKARRRRRRKLLRSGALFVTERDGRRGTNVLLLISGLSCARIFPPPTPRKSPASK